MEVVVQIQNQYQNQYTVHLATTQWVSLGMIRRDAVGRDVAPHTSAV